ncbi:hypothetical protein M4S82_01570 [Planococcus sp. MERTA32b]|nr:hypothetical protein [Planococcus sp. MER TA 32b]
MSGDDFAEYIKRKNRRGVMDFMMEIILIGVVLIVSSTAEKKLDSLGEQNKRVIELLEEIRDKK